MAQRRIVREALNTHRFARNHINNGSIPRFQELGTIFQLLSRTTIYLFLQLSKLASNVSCVTIQHRCISSTDLAWMVQDNHLSCEASFMVHFNRLDFSCNIDWSKGDHHTRLKNTSLHSTHWYSTNTTNFVDVLERQTQGLISWTSWWQNAIQGFKQCGSAGIPIFTGDFPSLEPRHVSTWLQHVVTIPTRNWHKCYCVRVVANFLNVGADFLNDFLLSLLAVGWLSGIHFVNTNN
uniref:Uncharacterized protein n=1 Tax=Canis lupus familiaris TaxID=9615 RepID=A0A8C0NUV9_CANLF